MSMAHPLLTPPLSLAGFFNPLLHDVLMGTQSARICQDWRLLRLFLSHTIFKLT